jgi:hypothetical protein
MRKTIVFFICLSMALGAQAQETRFRLLDPAQTGIRFVNEVNETEHLNVLAYEYLYNGGGVAVGDFNNDGLQDIFLTANMRPNQLLLNKGNLKFEDITSKAHPELAGRKGGWKTGATVADVNGDGLLDIYLCYSGKVETDFRRNQLFINTGNGKFREMSQSYGLDHPGYSTQAAFLDYDNDGDLDMFLLNHNVKKIDNLELARYRYDVDSLAGNKLFRNDGIRFNDITAEAGIRQSPLSFGLGIAISDLDQDGWADIYVSNDYNEQDYCYINQKNGTFKEVSKDCFRYQSQFSMGVDIADFNNDALADVLTLDMLPPDNKRQKLLQLQENYESFQLMVDQGLHHQYMRNMLQFNNGDGTFSEIGQLAGIAQTDWSWSPLLVDLDNDGYKDIFVSNGYLRDYTNKDFLRYWGDYKVKKAIDREPVQLMDLIKAMPVTRYANFVFQNTQDLQFANRQQDWGMNQPSLSNGAAYADLDNDGDLDLIVNNINEPAFVYENRSRQNWPSSSHFLQIELKPGNANTRGIGARAYLYAHGKVQYQELHPSRGYLSAMPAIFHFGLGEQTHVDSVRIAWPDGKIVTYRNPPIDQQWLLDPSITGEQSRVPAQKQKRGWLKALEKPLLNYEQTARSINDFKRQPLMQFMYSSLGTVLAAGDVNADGLNDIWIGGDEGQPAKLFLQQPGGKFEANPVFAWDHGGNARPAAALMKDLNGDGHTDIYIARGGYDLWEPNSAALQDQLWLGDGKGHFSQLALPDLSASAKSCVRAADIDGDGDQDLFVGGRVVPGQYPVTPRSYLLINEKNKEFRIQPAPFDSAGMVTDAQWLDLNADGRPDLILAGEMMPIQVYLNQPGGFVDATSQWMPNNLSGFWNCLRLADLDGDGAMDIIAGNLGMNSPLHASEKEPIELFYADFDENGSIDPFLNFYVQGESYPFVSRDELNDQIYAMRRRFASYRDYAGARFADIFTADEIKKAQKRTATELRTLLLLQRGGKFVVSPLPVEAQFTSVNNIVASDINGDGALDLLLMGNRADNRLKLGSIEAGYGTLLLGSGKGAFQAVKATEAGISIKGDVKSTLTIPSAGKTILVIGRTEGPVLFYEY